MTSPSSSGAISPPFLRATTGSGGTAGVEKGRPLVAAGSPAGAASTFAALLELLAKEGRAGRSATASAIGAASAARSGVATGGATGDANAAIGTSDARRESEEEGDGVHSASDEVVVGQGATLDPMVQVLVGLAPRAAPASAPTRPDLAVLHDARAPIEQLMARLVRRVAWSGNARSGLARLELGAGELEGATLTIQADEGVVRVALDLPPGVDGAAWRERISGRLGARGLQVEAVEVA